MRKFLMTAAILLIAAPAAASGRQTFAFSCTPDISVRENNPVIKTYVGLNEFGHNRASFNVTHELASGEDRNRNVQYRVLSSTYRETNEGSIAIWRGVLKHNPAVSIVGRLDYGHEPEGVYTESWFDRGRFTNKVTISCVPEENEE